MITLIRANVLKDYHSVEQGRVIGIVWLSIVLVGGGGRWVNVGDGEWSRFVVHDAWCLFDVHFN